MKVAPLRYDVIFKKAFSNPKLFKALVKDFLQIDNFEIEEVENDKAFYPVVGNVNFKFDLFAEDSKNRIVVEMQHAHYSDFYSQTHTQSQQRHFLMPDGVCNPVPRGAGVTFILMPDGIANPT
jgi:hypothetical protein